VKRVFAAEVGITGLSLDAAREAGLDAEITVITARTRPAYVPGSGLIHVALVAERGSGRLLGGQIVGASGAAKRIDVLATVIAAGESVGFLGALDLGYAPPFSPVWDPLLVAARVATKRV
jgi:NADPH-dependent 2,4-dienoyl-CoA reductase/sulfur reductase-like enzyme